MFCPDCESTKADFNRLLERHNELVYLTKQQASRLEALASPDALDAVQAWFDASRGEDRQRAAMLGQLLQAARQ
jgi:hypothetical protein